jgi:glycosyltransferase involved in cell wall biosynthesis
MGSEPGVGWNVVREVSLRHEVTVLVRLQVREVLEGAIAADPSLRRIRFVYVDDPRCLRNNPILFWLDFDLWQSRAFREAKRLHAEQPFDIAHHVTLATWRVPTYLHKLGIPVVWGPVGGAQTMPAGFSSILGMRGRAWERLRSVAQCLSGWDPRIRSALRGCSAVLGANTTTNEFLRRLGARESDPLCEMAMDLAAIPKVERKERAPGPLRILWVGVHEPRKALPLLLHALALPGIPDWTLEVIGQGRERKSWEACSRRLGLSDRVSFRGALPRTETLKRFAEADIFVFCSLRDTTGWVLVEAMASGLPVISLDLASAHDMVGADRGILVSPEGLEKTAAGIAAALARLGADEGLRRRMGDEARRFVETNLTWTAYGEKLEAVYRRVVAERAR